MRKKLVALSMAVLMLAVAVIGGTLAYFTDQETVTNTFTVGNVDISVTEPNWDQEASGARKLMPGTTWQKDPTITLQEGSEEAWVFMAVDMNKFNSWLRLVGIQNGLMSYECTGAQACVKAGHCQGHFDETKLMDFFNSGDYQDAFDAWFGGVDHDAWKIMNLQDVLDDIKASWGDSTITHIKPIFGYKTTLKNAGDKATLFTTITMPVSVTEAQLADSRFKADSNRTWDLVITGYAIQKAELDTLDAAYTALFNK